MTLARSFGDRLDFAAADNYRLLPFRFARLDRGRYVATNDVGQHVVLDEAVLREFIDKRLSTQHPAYRTLKSKHFLFDEDSQVALDLLALKYRTRSEQTANFTALHIFVVTLRCDHSCGYCQVSRQTEDRTQYDMSIECANHALDFAFKSPSPSIKLEFQGGEPLLNFELIRHIVLRAQVLNEVHGKNLQFVIASNLSRLNDDILSFCKTHSVYFSTSLDGPADLHDENRPLRGRSSHEAAIAGIERIRERLGPDFVSALMTTTPASQARFAEIIDEYLRRGFGSIFLRSLSPYGFAVRGRLARRSSTQRWIEFYKAALTHIIELNAQGHRMREEFAAILLQKMFGASGSGYVDLQSPAGIAIAGIVYNYDGAIYASDEGRMLAEMGDHSFRLGLLGENTYESVMTSDALINVLEETMLESAPMCAECPFLPYCGADPVFHKATMGDVLGHKAFSAFCEKQMGVLRFLITLLEDDPSARDVLLSWVEH